jgi:Mannosyltransferase (PIG-V)
MPAKSLVDQLDDGQRAALQSAWSAFWRSRALVWASGTLAALVFGIGPAKLADPAGRTWPFGSLGNILVAPGARWDSSWYLGIAHSGYGQPPTRVFLPPYPLLTRVVGALFGSALIAGLVISCLAFFVALYLMHRLTALDFGEQTAGRAVAVLAFFPMSLFFSAVYTESLFLALSLASVYAARRGRWAPAGIYGFLAATTRQTGILIMVPLALLLLYGPREDARPSTVKPGWRPRYPIATWDLLSVVAIPAGLGVCVLYFALKYGDALSTFTEQSVVWYRHLRGPVVGFTGGVRTAGHAARALLSGAPLPWRAWGQIADVGFATFVLVAAVGALRRLPLAYGAYAAVGALAIMSQPVDAEPLISVGRYSVVLFPLFMWLALWCQKGRRFPLVLGASALSLAITTGLFANGHWVA